MPRQRGCSVIVSPSGPRRPVDLVAATRPRLSSAPSSACGFHAKVFGTEVFGTEITTRSRFSDMPASGPGKLPPEERDLVMHAELPILAGHLLMATDVLPSMGHEIRVGNNTTLCLDVESREEADRLYGALSEGGAAGSPMADMPRGVLLGCGPRPLRHPLDGQPRPGSLTSREAADEGRRRRGPAASQVHRGRWRERTVPRIRWAREIWSGRCPRHACVSSSPVDAMLTLMHRDDAEAFVETWVRSWNDHDIDGVMTHFSEAVVFTSPHAAQLIPGSGGIVRGAGSLRHYWKTGLQRVPDLHFEVLAVYVGVDTIVINYRNQRGGLANEVLVFRDGLVTEGHGTYVEAAPYHAPEPPRPNPGDRRGAEEGK